MAYHLDGSTIVLIPLGIDTNPGYMYNNSYVLWIVSNLSLTALNITCSYISEILAELLTAFLIINQSHVTFKQTIKSITVVANIFQVVLMVIVRQL